MAASKKRDRSARVKRAASSASSISPAPDLSILGDNVTILPPGYTAPAQDEVPEEQNLVGSMARFRDSPFGFLREVGEHVSGTGWRSYEKVIGQPVFYAGFSEEMKARVLSSTLLKDKIDALAKQTISMEEQKGFFDDEPNGKYMDRDKRLTQLKQQLTEVAENLTDQMICKMENKTFIRSAYYLCTQLLTRAYHQGIHVSSEEVLRLRAVAEHAQKTNTSIIFLPCHRSHIDYVSMQLICFRLGLGLPTVVAGDNLNFPLVGSFLQHAGAMWIRRSFGNDQLYTTLVQAYIDALVGNGYNFECFVEGGRSRTGKLLPPKFGILSYILDGVLSERVKDVIICPVSTQYDKVIEVDSYVSELLGQPKQKENLRDFLSSSAVLSLKLGRVDVRFHEPWSLRDFINQQRPRIDRMSSQLSDNDFRLRLLRTMGYRVLSEINAVSVIMPTALIGTVLLTLRGRGVGKSELIRRVEWLSERVRSQGGRVAHFARLPTSAVIERGLEVLGPKLVGVVEGLPEETYYAVDRFQLSFYRNMTIHLFILQALVSAGMYTRVKQGGGPENQRISHKGLREQVQFLSQLFRGEFIFPTEGLDVNLHKTLKCLEADDVIEVTRSEHGGEIEWVGLSENERKSGRENYDFYCFLIWPFIEASWLGAVSLMMLTPPPGGSEDTWLEEKMVQEAAQLLGKTLYHQGDLSYFEAVNKETLKNNYQRFEEEGIIIVSRGTDKAAPPKVRLADGWVPTRDGIGNTLPQGKLWDFSETISQSRREGKNRRDGATVQTRVLAHVQYMGAQLFELTDTSIPADGTSPRTRRRNRGLIQPIGNARARL